MKATPPRTRFTPRLPSVQSGFLSRGLKCHQKLPQVPASHRKQDQNITLGDKVGEEGGPECAILIFDLRHLSMQKACSVLNSNVVLFKGVAGTEKDLVRNLLEFLDHFPIPISQTACGLHHRRPAFFLGPHPASGPEGKRSTKAADSFQWWDWIGWGESPRVSTAAPPHTTIWKPVVFPNLFLRVQTEHDTAC